MVKHVSRLARLSSKLLTFVLCVALLSSVVINVFFSDTTDRAALISAELQNLQVINGNIEQRNHEMTQRVEAMRTDSRLLEAMAREELGMIRSGETLFLFPPEFDAQFADASLVQNAR